MLGSKQQKNTLSNPVCTCPNCEGNCHIFNIGIGCEKCATVYPLSVSTIESTLKLSKANIELIKTDIGQYINNMNLLAKTVKTDNNENDVDIFSVNFAGKLLEYLKFLKAEYNFESLKLVVKFIIEGFFFILKEMKSMNGEEVFLVDSNGNKSKNLRKEFLGHAYASFIEEKNREIVNNYIGSLNILFKIDDIKKGFDKERKE